MKRTKLAVVSTATVAVSRVGIAAIGLHWVAEGHFAWSAVAAVAVTLTFLPARLVRDPMLRDAANIVLAALLAAHVALGMQGALYETSTMYDKWMHALGTGLVAGWLVVAARRYCVRHRVELPLVLFMLLVLGGAVSVGTLWEMFEFAVDRTGLFTAQRGLHDTMLDLMSNTTGAVLVTAMCGLWSLRAGIRGEKVGLTPSASDRPARDTFSRSTCLDDS